MNRVGITKNYYVVKTILSGWHISPFGLTDKGSLASFPFLPLLSHLYNYQIWVEVSSKMDILTSILELIYDTHDFISKYVQKIFKE